MCYWKDCIAEACEDAKVKITDEQTDIIASWVEGAHENFGMAHGYDVISSPASLEVEQLKLELKAEREKETCGECRGSGTIVDIWGSSGRSSISTCSACNGYGRK